MQWELDADKAALVDTASGIRTNLDTKIEYADTTSLVAMQWQVDADIAALVDTASGIRTNLDTKVEYADTTSLIAMQWELDADKSALIDTASAIRTNLDQKQATITNIADTSKYIEYSDTTSLIAMQWELDQIQGASGIPYSDTTSVIAMQWELDVNKIIASDSIAAIRSELTDFDTTGLAAADSSLYVIAPHLGQLVIASRPTSSEGAADSTFRSAQIDSIYALAAGNQVYIGDSLTVLGKLSASNLYGVGDSTGWSAKDSLYNVLAVHNGQIYSVERDERVLQFAISDDSTAITAKGPAISFRMPFKAYITKVRASLKTASSSGTPTFDINEGGTSILSTKLTIDANELTSVDATDAAVISDRDIADDAAMTVDIDVAGTGAVGAKISIYYRIVP